MLLTEALAETDQVPARRHRRYKVERGGQISASGADEAIQLVNISASGCCLRLADPRNSVGVGTQVEVHSAGFRATGTVVWSRYTERGIRFDRERAADVERYVKSTTR
jgi:hypothetical protein